jgi:hypothetical protein
MISEYTINEMQERLAQLDELTILELLDITSEELVLFLQDQIIEKYDQLLERFSDDEDGD